MSKDAEKLIILLDVARGLLARVYNLLPQQYEKPAIINQDIEKVTKFLAKRFPDQSTTEIEKVQGYELFKKNSQEIVQSLRDYYMTWLDVLRFSEAAWKLIVDLTQNTTNFTFQYNLDLLSNFMDLFVSYMQIHLLLSKADNFKLFLSTYSKAYLIAVGNVETSWASMVKLCGKLDRPIDALREQCIELNIDDTLLGFVMLLSKWSEFEVFTQKNVFNVLDDVKTMDTDKFFDDHTELLHVDKLTLWTLYGFLFCPEALAKDNAFALLQICLKSTFRLPIYRDVMLNIDAEFYDLFDNYKLKTLKLSKHTKILKEVYADASGTYTKRAKMRTFLRCELQTLFHFFSDFPQLLAPKFQMVMALLRLARNEVVWYFQHLDFSPFKAKKPKPEEYNDPRISELIYYVDRISELINETKTDIQEFYMKRLQILAKDQAFANFPNSARVTKTMTDLLNQILSVARNPSIGEDFEAMRLNWYKLSAVIFYQQQQFPQNEAQALAKPMIKLIANTNFIDRIDSQLRHHASFSELFWYREQLSELMIKGFYGPNHQPKASISFIRILSHAVHSIHRFCPEEQTLIGERAVKTAENWLQATIEAAMKLVEAIGKKHQELHDQISPLMVFSKGDYPGFESSDLARDAPIAREMRAWKMGLADICEAIAEVPEFTVYDTCFIPREYLYEAMRDHLRMQLRAIVISGKSFARPTVVLDKLSDLLRTYHLIDTYLPINLSDIINEILFLEFVDLQGVSGCGRAIPEDPADKEIENRILVHAMANWYISILQQNLHELGITYSDIRRGFVTRPGNFPLRAEDYLDETELIALCRIIGPYGVRFIEKHLLSKITRNAEQLSALMKANMPVLKALKGRFTQSEFWLEQVAQLKGLDKLMEHATVMGCLLRFRKLLKGALEAVTKQSVPFIFHSVVSLFGLRSKLFPTQHPAVAALDILAADCGLQTSSADPSLRAALQRIILTDAEAWCYLPEFFGVCFVSPVWKSNQTKYLIETESYTNNVDCVAACIDSLIRIYHGVTGVETKATTDAMAVVDQKTKQTMEQFLHCAASTILHIASNNKGMFKDFEIKSIMVFIEKFVLETRTLKLSMLESFLPYTILRANYIQMYEKQSVKGISYASVDDDDNKPSTQ